MSWIKKITGVMLLAAVLVLTAALPYLMPGGTAYADGPKLELKTELGYNGHIKLEKWNPLKLVLTSDRDLKGDIVVRVQSSNGYGQWMSFVQHVELPKGTEKEVTIGVPGYHFHKQSNEIIFYEGSYKDGKPIPFSSGKSHIVKNPYMGVMIGVLSDDPDTMNFLAALNGKGSALTTIPMKKESIHSDAMLLDGLDVLVINNFASDTLSEAQVNAVKAWVKSGGMLVLSGGAGYTKTAAPFADISPVQAKGTMEVNQLPELQKLGKKPLKLEENITISSSAPVKEARVDASAAGVPLFAMRELEQGSVWYAAYDVAMEPVSSWSGHPEAWASVLRSEVPLVNNNTYYGSPINNLHQVLDYFPSIKMPSFSMMVWMLLAYAVIVAPLLYFILKKADKREWAWFLIPLIAVIASGVIYVMGSSDKTKELAHTINAVELDGKGKGVTAAASAFFTPKSGDYELEFPENTYIISSRQRGGFSGGDGADNKDFIRVEEEQTTLELLDMPQWSLAKVWIDSREPQETGKFGVHIDVDPQGKITGSVKNETANDLTEVVLVVSGKAYKLGDIPRNGSAPIPDDKKSVLRVMGDLASQIYPYGQNYEFNRQREVLQQYSHSSPVFTGGSYIIGWSKDPWTEYKQAGQVVQGDQLNLWMQQVTIEWDKNGNINIPYGFISAEIVQSNSPNMYITPNGVELGQGNLIAEFPLADLGDVQYSQFSLKGIKLNKGLTMEIWNQEKNDWEKVTGKQGVMTVNEKIENYIVDKRIRLLVSSINSQPTMLKLPELSLKGVKK